MNQAARQRLQAAVNRLTLRKTQIAKSLRGNCSFCDDAICPGDNYRAAGSLQAHTACLSALSMDLRARDRQ